MNKVLLVLFLAIAAYSDCFGQQDMPLNNAFRYDLNRLPLDTTFKTSSIMVPTFKASALPFFCKWEHKSDSYSPLKLRFRLGSLDYTNRLERK